jgi:gliding motility-associated-like protein
MKIIKLIFSFFCVITVGLLLPTEVKATHAQGADFSYECLGGDTFRISLTFFRDCEGIDEPATASVNLNSISCSRNLNVTLQPESAPLNVSSQFLCPAEVGNNACNGGSLPGTTQVVYSAIVVLPQACADWVVSYDLCCRNDLITNLSTPGSRDLYVASTINNANNNVFCNSSPTYGSLPIVYACAGRPFSYNPSAVDPDGDSLSFTLINPLSDPGQNIPYTNAGFNPNNPLNTSSGFQFNPLTGQMNFTPTGIQAAVITTLVREFRNGVLVGTTIRDLQVVTVNCGPGTPPTLSNIDSLAGGNSIDSLTVSVCPGEQVNFVIRATDDPGDILTLLTNVSQTIPNATFDVINIGNVIRANFSWIPTVLDTGVNFFTVTISDSLSCPIRSTITKSYIINVLFATSAGPDLSYCTSGGPVQLQAIGGTTFTWSPIDGLSNPNIANPIASPSVTTNYIVESNLSSLCKNRDTVTVFKVDDFLYSISNDTSICRNGSVPLAVTADPSFAPFQFNWTPSNTLTVDNTFNTVATPEVTTNYVAIVTAANGCTIKDSVVVTISGVGPLVIITSDKDNVCPGDTVQLNAQIYDLTCGPTIASCSAQNPPTLRNYGTGANTSNSGATPFQGTNQDARTQILYRASELNSAGINTGTIVGITLSIGTFTSVRAYENFTIKMACTDQTNLSLATGFLPVSTVVFGPTNITTQNGINNFTFSTPYDWDGISNLVIEICYDNAALSPGGNDQVVVTNTNYTSMMRNFGNNTSGCSLNAAFSYQEIPNTQFRICSSLPRSYTNTWIPTTGLSNPNSLTPSLVVNENVTYELNVDDGQCVSVGRINLTVDDSYNIDASIDPGYQCGDDSVQLSVVVTGIPPVPRLNCGANNTSCINPPSITVGTGNVLNTITDYPAPFGNYWESSRQQFLYRASELTAAGLTTGTISSIAFNVSSIAGGTTYRNYTVKVICTNLNTLNPAGFVPGAITVFNPKTINITTGWNNLPLDITYDWDGVSNLIVEVCHNNDLGTSTDWTNNSRSPGTNVGYTASLFGLIDNADACPLNDPEGSSIRPNTRFFNCAGVFSPETISWTPANTLINPTTANPIAVPLGATTYVVQYTFTNGCVRNDSVTVSPTNFEASVSNDTAICLGNAAILSVIGGDEYLWAPAIGLSSSTSATVTASPTETTTYVVTTTDNVTGCVDRDTITVTVNPLPVIAFSGNNQQCFQNELTIDAGAGFVSYLWEPTQEITQTITVDVEGTYAVTVVDVNGCENTDEIVLSIGTPPVVDLGNDLAGCDGDVFILDAGAGFDAYEWSTTETTSSISVTTTGVYIVIVTDADGCAARDTVNVTIVSPTLNLGNDTTICSGEFLRIVAGASGPDYLWSTTETTPSILVSTSDTYSVTVTVSGATTCTATDEIVVTVNEPIVVDLGSNNITCSGNPLVLDAGAGFASYEWSPNGETTQTIAVLTSGIYSVTVTDAFGCTGSDVLSVIDINPVVDAGNNQSICQGESATLTATSSNANVTYNWTPGNQTTASITVNTAGSYIVTATDANGCFGVDTVVVTVFATPVPDLGANVSICGNESVTLSSAGSFTTYEWSTNETTSTITVSNADTYSLTVTDANGCAGTDDVVVSVLGDLVIELDDFTVCSGEAVTITAPVGFTTYSWTSGETTQSIIATQQGEYTVQVTDDNGCNGAAISNVSYYTYTVEATANPSVINKGETAQLTAVVSGGSGNYTYSWTPAQGLDNSTIANPVATPDDTTVYTVTVTDITNECAAGTDTTLVEVILESRFAVPDAFTPDGDGKNDLFEIFTSGNITVSEFRIYNRWGELIHDATSGWDGIYKGEPQPVGTYGYYAVLINADGSKEIIKNAFTLIR